MTKSEQINQILHQHIKLVFKDAVDYKSLIKALLEWSEGDSLNDGYITKKFYIKRPKQQSNEQARTNMINDIYGLSVIYFETIGEHGKFIRGNGHHMAQELADYAEQMWKKRQL